MCGRTNTGCIRKSGTAALPLLTQQSGSAQPRIWRKKPCIRLEKRSVPQACKGMSRAYIGKSERLVNAGRSGILGRNVYQINL